jgi:RecJ-like exonuclease
MDIEECAAEIRRIVASFHNPLLVYHYDADGISAGAITFKWLKRMGKQVKTMWVKGIDEHVVEQLRRYNEIVFVDVGNADIIKELKDVVLIDHHLPANHGKPQFNPHLCGYNGSTDLTSSGASAWLSNDDEDLAVVGMVGDLFDPRATLNTVITQKGIDKHILIERPDLNVYGRYQRNLIHFLLYNNPPLPFTTEQEVYEFLKRLHIPFNQRTVYEDLGQEEKKKLITALCKLMGYSAKSVLGYVYELPRYADCSFTYEAKEFATLLNATGRHNMADVGFNLIVKGKEWCQRAQQLLTQHKREIREGLAFAKAQIKHLNPNTVLIDGRGMIKPGVIGIVCSALFSTVRKNVIGLSEEDGKVKVSVRAFANAGPTMRTCAERVGGQGGGHECAAGAFIQQDRLKEFLNCVEEKL